jgi:hypothetical protein
LRALRVFIGTLFCLGGLFVVLLEIAMSISEAHALSGSGVYVFTFATLVALSLACLGYRLIRE